MLGELPLPVALVGTAATIVALAGVAVLLRRHRRYQPEGRVRVPAPFVVSIVVVAIASAVGAIMLHDGTPLRLGGAVDLVLIGVAIQRSSSTGGN
jgi:hypothetical protein